MRMRVQGHGVPVIKLAGAAGGVGIFREEVEMASTNGYRVAALDTTGDRRDDPVSAPLDWDFFTGELIETINRLDEERVILWGTSFGSVVALAAAARLQTRIAGLLLCFPPDPYRRPRVFMKMLDWAGKQRNRKLVFRSLFVLLFGGMTAWEFLMPLAAMRALPVFRAALEAGTPSTTISGKLQLLWSVDPLNGLDRLDTPARLIAGRLDPVAPASGARRVASLLPNSSIRFLPFAGHSGHYSFPGQYMRLVLQDLEELSTTWKRTS